MKIFLMHQTHTDIGYTERQEKLEWYHVEYLKQAIVISEAIRSGEKKEWEGFVWNNETHWIIETFLKSVDDSWKERLFDAIKAGHIQLTANFLNMTDLVDESLLKKYLEKAVKFGKSIGVKINTALAQDVNGFGWGYAQALYDTGVRRFYTCVHNHHGFYPFAKKHHVFYWETPKHNKILVWNGDVYHLGNLAKIPPNVYLDTPLINFDDLEYTYQFLTDYIQVIKKQGYNFDFLPVVTKGLFVDNAPPNPYIMDKIRQFNQLYGHEITIEMIGINTFFDYVESLNLDIPTLRGDWPDWWSDGYMSTPDGVMLYREALRSYHKISSLIEKGYKFSLDKLTQLEDNLMMYAEHTWGYFTSVGEPWNKMTKKLEDRKNLLASLANKYADELIDEFTISQKEAAKQAGRPLRYKVVNPYNYEREELVKLYINWWEEYQVETGYKVINLNTNEELEYQETRVDDKSRRVVNVWVKLQPYESILLEIQGVKVHKPLVHPDPLYPRYSKIDYVSPYMDNQIIATQFGLETPYVRIKWEKDLGITEIKDKKHNCSLIRKDIVVNPFTPIYEVSKIDYKYQFSPVEIKQVRSDFGRNRKTFSSERFVGRLINTRVLACGQLYGKVELKYELPGTIYATIEITAYRDLPQIDISFICGKETVWEPESIYLSLPFSYQEAEELWIDKTGTLMRPRIDQLPKTLTQFYTVDNGFALVSKQGSLVVSLPDVPLIYLGKLEPDVIKLAFDEGLSNPDIIYSWVMNNYWETNFSTSLGGFYQFNYRLYFSDTLTNEIDALKKAKDLNSNFIVFPVK
ncbi:MAG: hypothetical protein GX490_00795 [Bacilli bacterium]|nr:hypothetical protein [Bacilli bacterium]